MSTSALRRLWHRRAISTVPEPAQHDVAIQKLCPLVALGLGACHLTHALCWVGVSAQVALFPEKDGYAIGSIEGKVGVQYFQVGSFAARTHVLSVVSSPQVIQRWRAHTHDASQESATQKHFSFRCHRSESSGSQPQVGTTSQLWLSCSPDVTRPVWICSTWRKLTLGIPSVCTSIPVWPHAVPYRQYRSYAAFSRVDP